MMTVGRFYNDQDGIMHGRIQALGLGNVDAVFEQRTSKNDTPYFKIIADPLGSPFEIGAAWLKEKDGLRYYSVSLYTALSLEPINAALFPDRRHENTFNLVWNMAELKPKAAAKPEEGTSPAAGPKAELKTSAGQPPILRGIAIATP